MNSTVKGIILAGGHSTRLYPATKAVSKQLLPIYDKPMVCYPLSVLMLSGIRDILMICNPNEEVLFQRLLGDGSDYGLSISYTIQPSPDGLAQAFILGEEFIGDDPVSMILGDNIFYGHDFVAILQKAKQTMCEKDQAVVFAYKVSNPQDYGVVEFDANDQAIEIEEKPKNPKSSYAVTGLYFYPNDVVEIAKTVKPSARGELEITSVNNAYIEQKRLTVERLGHGFAWLDTGTAETLLQASLFVETIEKRQNFNIACLEEIAFKLGYISAEKLEQLATPIKNIQYKQYLLNLLKDS